ncbi:hypothetical protein Pcinc_033994 [Petrolisthes cinctipes]|uniref:Uncharacterized protein n=1 Tax=Petrolisthes cinctipes TaxID=88211 RepID=A0AAE1ER32_PETCI|nr:hypothetical protein Pcinc_033994 [Petrolisthes cinctipes]
MRKGGEVGGVVKREKEIGGGLRRGIREKEREEGLCRDRREKEEREEGLAITGLVYLPSSFPQLKTEVARVGILGQPSTCPLGSLGHQRELLF